MTAGDLKRLLHCRRSAQRKRDSAQPRETDRRYSCTAWPYTRPLVKWWDVRDESLMVGHFVDVPGRVARVYQQAVHLDHPGHGIVFHPAWQCPFRVELINLEHLANGQRLCLTGALGHPEGPID